MTDHVFIDESKQRAYLLVAAVVVPSDLKPSRQILKGLLLPNQRRIHMKDESNGRRRTIASSIATMGITATVYQAGQDHRTQLACRRACLAHLVKDRANAQRSRLVIDRDESLVPRDRQCLIDAMRVHGLDSSRLTYEHDKAHHEPLLALPDAIAWCWAKGGYWRSYVRDVVEQVYV